MNEEFEGYENYSGIKRSVRRSKNYKGTYQFDKWDDYYDHGNEDAHLTYKLMFRFIEKNVGRPYDKVYGEFCGKWPALINGYINTREYIKNQCGVGDESYRPYYRGKNNPFYITDSGIIKKNLNSWKYEQKNKYVDITVPGSSKTAWIINKALLDWSNPLHYYLYSRLGYKTVEELRTADYITSSKVIELLHDIESNFNWWMRPDSYDNKNFNRESYRKAGGWVIKTITISDKISIKIGSPEHSRYIHESFQASKRDWKRRKKEIQKENDTLLHDICEKKKAEEAAKNLIDRDRLGFDENSFIGEPYHGQKRKKKK